MVFGSGYLPGDPEIYRFKGLYPLIKGSWATIWQGLGGDR